MNAAVRLTAVVALTLAWAGCLAQEPEPAPAPAAQAAPAPAPVPTPAAPPAPALAGLPTIRIRFTCEDLTVSAVVEPGQAVLSLPGRALTLPRAISASGARYNEGSTTFWNRGREATFELDGRSRHCVEATSDDAWTATPGQIGPVRIGMTAMEAETALGAPFTPADAGECSYRRSSALPTGVMLMQVNGVIVRADVTAAGVSTTEGLGVGSTAAQVREIHGARLTVTPHKYTEGQYLTLAPDAEHRIVFETDGQHVTRYRVGRLPEVEWVEGCA